MNFVRSKISSPATLAGGGGAGAAKFCTGDEGSRDCDGCVPSKEVEEGDEDEDDVEALSVMADSDEVNAGGRPSFWNPVGLFLWINTVS